MGWFGILDNPAEVEQLVIDHIEKGYDFLKVYYLKKGVFHALIAAAKQHDIPVIGHASDDVGMQDRTTVSPEMYRRLIKPSQARAFRFIHECTPAPLMYHTCGSVYAILDDLIEIGIDALNPVQTDAANMEAHRLKRDFGYRISIWGGINSSCVLPWGTPCEVWEEVQRVIGALAPGGGYILNSVHNVQPGVPVENLLAMFSAAREFGEYPLSEHQGAQA